MPFCTYCGSSFARDEHLERHILTHTGLKPFKCGICHMSFARKDLLHRHHGVHDRNGSQDPANTTTSVKPSGRTPIACSNCAKNKTKCDRKFPCSRCASRNLRCELRPAKRPSKKIPRPEDGDQAAADVDESLVDDAHEDQSSQSEPVSSGTSTPADTLSRRQSYFNPPTSQSVAHSRQASMASAASPAPSPIAAFSVNSPVRAIDGFLKADGVAKDTSALETEPQFNFDWSSLQRPLTATYDQLCQSDMLIDPSIPYSPDSLQEAASSELLPMFVPSFTPGPQPLASPMSAQSFDPSSSFPLPMPQPETLSDSSSSYKQRAQSQSSSTTTSNFNADLDAIVTSQDAWSAFKCIASLPSIKCPKTARINLEKLEETLQSHDAWTDWQASWDQADYALGDNLEAVPLQEAARDKLLAITQSFLHKAFEIHSQDQSSSSSSGPRSPRAPSNFIILPPARVLDCCLRSYGNSFERFYPLSPRRSLNPNAIMYGNNDKASSLLLLLMIAQGALISPAVDGRWLVGGLTEACRISLYDLVEKNIMMSGDPSVLHSALLFIHQAGWSGDKWQMDIAMGQRGLYFAMLRHSGYLEAGERQASSPAIAQNDLESVWNEWMWQEKRSRLVYSWMMVDQELSLFYDTPPLFLVTEFGAPMPDAERLWHAKSAQEWSTTYEQVHRYSGGLAAIGNGVRPHCLRDLFKLFLEDDASVTQNVPMTALQLHLLLHPLQSVVWQVRQLMSCFSESSSLLKGSNSQASANVMQERLEEVGALLQRWYGLAQRYLSTNPMCPMMHASLVIFHLISLNTVSNIPEIERLARCEGIDGSFQSILWAHRQGISDVEKAIFHSGQVLRLIKQMPRSIRPPWWAGAIYRVALVFWCDSLVHNGMLTPGSGFSQNAPTFAVDALTPDHPTVAKYLTSREGTPSLTKRDGSPLPLDDPSAVLFHCVDVISEGVSTRFTEGISNKLMRLARS